MSVDSNIRDVPVLSIILIPLELAVNLAPGINNLLYYISILYVATMLFTNAPQSNMQGGGKFVCGDIIECEVYKVGWSIMVILR